MTKYTDNLINERHSYAVLWMAAGFNDYGEVTVASPIEIDVRIEEGLIETLDEKGNKIATPTLINVPIDIEVGSFMWLGRLDDLPATPDLLQVVEFEKIPDIERLHYDRNVKAMKAKAGNPELA